MVEPPTRSSLWRYGFGTPVNFYDDDVNCGGFQVQHVNNEGMCGVCGDPWNAPTPRDNEAGGTLAPNPLPVRVYKKGGFIPVAVDSTSELLGKYEFRLCKLESNKETPDQHCFDQYRLSIVESEYGQSYQISQSGGLISLHLKLPEDMVCSHCLLQWRHITGFKTNRQGCVQCGTEEPQCNYCKGCGDQEWYQGCADIAVIDVMGSHPAVLGVLTQQELKDKWEAFLKNCTVGGDDKKGPSSIDNKINISYIFSESTSSDFASSLWQNVTDAPSTKLAVTFPITATATVTGKIETATTLQPSLSSPISCAADPKSQPSPIESSPRNDKEGNHPVANTHTVLLLPTVGDSKLVPPTKTPELNCLLS
ncbi:hypothetical protein C0Q70_03400 [Pomacea canaliculata]|uniref:Chitin-binding type-4 domain-containing protein n=2 Tax=Pomacea canaliculata TaxID=400727 RepID=A0A2T7PSQ5_POMCA|nr:hypothetical protein C0Q70_03400 [Pomacea canaliculata]